MSKYVPDCTILIVGFNKIPGGGMSLDLPSFQGFFLFLTGTPVLCRLLQDKLDAVKYCEHFVSREIQLMGIVRIKNVNQQDVFWWVVWLVSRLLGRFVVGVFLLWRFLLLLLLCLHTYVYILI